MEGQAIEGFLELNRGSHHPKTVLIRFHAQMQLFQSTDVTQFTHLAKSGKSVKLYYFFFLIPEVLDQFNAKHSTVC